MSRHLMAKFCRLAGEAYDWRPEPAGWVGYTAPHPPKVPKWNEPHEHSSAIVHHGEQRYALEVKPHRRDPLGKIDSYAWGIFQHGDDHETIAEKTGWTWPGHWPKDFRDDSPADYIGYKSSHEEAQAEAQRNWELHKEFMDGQRNDALDSAYDDIAGPRSDLDDDFGDIFGDRS